MPTLAFKHKGKNELHKIMSAYRYAELPRQLWATLTPVSENWTVAQLLEELRKKDEAAGGSARFKR